MNTLRMINYVISVLFLACYCYQFLYIPVSLFVKKKKGEQSTVRHRFAILISARNEEKVIGDLLDSLNAQDYPEECRKVFVVADNCTDDTALIAKGKGAEVYVRHNTVQVGKGYALDYLLSCIQEEHPEGYDGYLVFDADNILKKDYLSRINDCYSAGNDIITSYRNSKNYGSNWISAGYALWFLRESRYLNHARSLLNTSCAVSGTGFFFSDAVLKELGGWPFHLLTEDIEFSIHEITRGRKIAFCKEAELYDEQPVDFRQSWRQRMRWSKGYIQVFRKYGADLFKGLLRGDFSCMDMFNTIMPAFVLSVASVLCNLLLSVYGAVLGEDLMIGIVSLGEFFFDMYLTFFTIGLLTTFTEWKKILAPAYKKVLYVFTFPLFMFTYVPISFVSLFMKVSWKPIEHTMSLEKLRMEGTGRF